MSKLRWIRIGAAGGIGFVGLQLVAQALVQLGGSEPAFSGSAQEILAFFQAKDPSLFPIADYLSAVSLVAFLWFLGSLWATMYQAEEKPAWLSLVAVASGVMAIASTAGASGWPLAVFRVDEGLDPQLARYLFDEGNYAFATLWVFLASFLLATGLVVSRTGVLPRWQAWLGGATAVGLLIARAVWAGPSGLVFLPYMLFWVWLIATSVSLLKQPASAAEFGDDHEVLPAGQSAP